jgi:glyoxylase I family protein
MRPIGIHHVSINVGDVPQAQAFYTEILGFVSRTDRPDFGFDGAWLDVGSQQVHLIKGNVPSANGQHYAIWVDDIEATVKEIRGKGVEVTDPIPVGRGLQAFLSDPAGNAIELHQVPA